MSEHNISYFPLQTCCEDCGRKSKSLAYFRGQNICMGCYLAHPKELRDAIARQIDEYEKSRQ
jgi:hypothetical protein